ncbi:uncharacterized protein GIQ15_06276 [Arthroderma uncinatum]|uniref:uncharacterized protein n=1 Tax=Arthroderma uncinatum TaxID=74035 RepID=UPI00144A6461|nr:uncharacterized protein GIQ15_06276 [Arthroderma uncinatum]KAF3480929.1 hypothetical protein GIQ15_06276 [Arthroderma uncinatum]
MTRSSHLTGRTRDARKAAAAFKASVKSKNVNMSQLVPSTRPMRGQKGTRVCRHRPRALLEYSGSPTSQSKLPVKVSIRRALDEAVRETRGTESSSDEEEFDPTVTPEEPELFYSFDAHVSPAEGGHVLSAAVIRAVDKYETKQTEKLAREYEFIGVMDSNDLDEGYGGYDEGFELIEPVNY